MSLIMQAALNNIGVLVVEILGEQILILEDKFAREEHRFWEITQIIICKRLNRKNYRFCITQAA